MGCKFYVSASQIISLPYFLHQRYASTITEQVGLRGKPKGELGEQLDASAVEMLKDDQVVQLYELMLAAKGLNGDTITADDVRGSNK